MTLADLTQLSLATGIRHRSFTVTFLCSICEHSSDYTTSSSPFFAQRVNTAQTTPEHCGRPLASPALSAGATQGPPRPPPRDHLV